MVAILGNLHGSNAKLQHWWSVSIGQRFPGHGDDDPQSPAMSKFIPDQCPILPEVPIWLVLGHPSQKYESQLGWLFPIYGKIENVPNHQPAIKWSGPQELPVSRRCLAESVPSVSPRCLLRWWPGDRFSVATHRAIGHEQKPRSHGPLPAINWWEPHGMRTPFISIYTTR